MSCISFFSLFMHPQPKPKNAVTIAVSSRTLFNMKAERKIFEEEGLEKYVAFQQEHENEPLKPGPAFPFVKVGLGPCTVKPAVQGVSPQKCSFTITTVCDHIVKAREYLLINSNS